MLNFINRPYPYKFASLRDVGFYLLIGVFVSAFLIVFQPFDINLWVTDFKKLKLIGYGLVAFIMPSMLSLIRKLMVNERKLEYTYTIKDEILWLLILIICIAAGNMLYSNWIGILQINLNSFLIFIVAVFTVGIFPVLGSIWLKHSQYQTLNKKEANAIEENIQSNAKESDIQDIELIFIAENEKETLSIKDAHLLYIESMDNYCQFVYLDDLKLKKQILRGTLKRFEAQNRSDKIRKCHRSFIVNLNNVVHIDGNAQGYNLYFNHENITVPVSRNFGPEVKKYFSK